MRSCRPSGSNGVRGNNIARGPRAHRARGPRSFTFVCAPDGQQQPSLQPQLLLQPQLHPQLQPQLQLLLQPQLHPPPHPPQPPPQIPPFPLPQQQHRMMIRMMIQQQPPPPKPLLFHIKQLPPVSCEAMSRLSSSYAGGSGRCQRRRGEFTWAPASWSPVRTPAASRRWARVCRLPLRGISRL